MKIRFIFLTILMFFAFSCITDDAYLCINALDCEPGYLCVDGACIPGEGMYENNDGGNDNPYGQPENDKKEETPDVNEIENDEAGEQPDEVVEQPDDVVEQPDENDVVIECKPDSCSGNGDCSVVGEEIVCTCDEGYAGDNCSKCADGFFEESGQCVPAMSCDPDPCNGVGECLEMGNTVTCNCDSKYTGQWCENCVAGYLKSNVDGECKPDCITGNINCLEHMECKINPDTNEAGCDCKNGYFGTNCTQCDPNHFCSSRGTCSVLNNVATCTCNTGYGGANCSTCASGYKDFNSDGICYEDCHSSCGQSESFFNQASHGECVFNGTKGVCECKQGWKDPIIMIFPMVPECSECVKNNPPPEHSTDGCPASCKNSDGDYILCGSNGKCYFEITGSNKRYCKCNSGYSLNNGDPYSGTCVQ